MFEEVLSINRRQWGACIVKFKITMVQLFLRITFSIFQHCSVCCNRTSGKFDCNFDLGLVERKCDLEILKCISFIVWG